MGEEEKEREEEREEKEVFFQVFFFSFFFPLSPRPPQSVGLFVGESWSRTQTHSHALPKGTAILQLKGAVLLPLGPVVISPTTSRGRLVGKQGRGFFGFSSSIFSSPVCASPCLLTMVWSGLVWYSWYNLVELLGHLKCLLRLRLLFFFYTDTCFWSPPLVTMLLLPLPPPSILFLLLTTHIPGMQDERSFC